MPFNTSEYRAWCRQESTTIATLEAEYRNYSKQLATGVTTAAVGGLLAIPTFGLSILVGGVGGGAVAANAGAKMDIIKEELEKKRNSVAMIRGGDITRGVGNGIGYAAGGVAAANYFDPGLFSGV